MSKAKAGNRDAFLRLWLDEGEPAVRKVVGRLFRYHPDDVSDMVQDVYIKASGAIAQHKGSGSFAAWACSIALHACLDDYRVRNGRTRKINMLPFDEAAHENQCGSNVVNAYVREGAAIEMLLAKQVFAETDTREQDVILGVWEGYTAPEIAARLNLGKPDEVYRILNRFRDRIRRRSPTKLAGKKFAAS